MWQPRLGITWDPNKDGKTVVRANGGIFYGPHPGPRPRVGRGRRTAASATTSSTTAPFDALLGSAARVPEHPESRQPPGDAGPPGRVRLQTRTSRTRARTSQRRASSARWRRTSRSRSSTTTRTRSHIGRFINRNDALLGSPVVDRASAPTARTASGRSRPLESTGAQRLQRHHARPVKRYTNNFEFQAYLHALLGQVGRRQRARSVHVPLREGHGPRTPSTATRTATSATASTRYVLWKAPGDDQRERALAVPLGPAAVDHGDAAPRRDTVAADGPDQPGRRASRERNLGRKDNQFNSVDLRISRPFVFGNVTVEPIAEVFNLFNSKNLKDPTRSTRPALQLRRHRAERPRRPAPGAARRPRRLLGSGSRAGGVRP